jgi:hypothetical protein
MDAAINLAALLSGLYLRGWRCVEQRRPAEARNDIWSMGFAVDDVPGCPDRSVGSSPLSSPPRLVAGR